MEEIFDKLDLKKIINRTAGYAITDGGKNLVLEEKPQTDISEVEKSLNLTFALKRFIEEVNEINYTYLPDVRNSILKSRIENFVLNNKDIIQIGKLLINARTIKSTISQYKNKFSELWEFVN